jgi:hypothetical protein
MQKSTHPLGADLNLRAHLETLGVWTTKQTAEFLGVKEVTVRTWRRLGNGPRFVNPTPGMVRYLPEDVRNWLEQSARLSTSAHPAAELR